MTRTPLGSLCRLGRPRRRLQICWSACSTPSESRREPSQAGQESDRMDAVPTLGEPALTVTGVLQAVQKVCPEYVCLDDAVDDKVGG